MKAILALAAMAVLVTPAEAVDFRTGANSPKIYAPGPSGSRIWTLC